MVRLGKDIMPRNIVIIGSDAEEKVEVPGSSRVMEVNKIKESIQQ